MDERPVPVESMGGYSAQEERQPKTQAFIYDIYKYISYIYIYPSGTQHIPPWEVRKIIDSKGPNGRIYVSSLEGNHD